MSTGDPGGTRPAVIDLAFARQHVPDGEEGLRFVAGLLLEDLPSRIAALKVGLAGGRAPDVRLAAHSIKGSVLTFGASESAEAALAVERLAAAGNLPAAATALPTLESALERLRGALRQLLGGATPGPA
jgi:HPt (histidine-containing phosphotransfer) domain-containing protein